MLDDFDVNFSKTERFPCVCFFPAFISFMCVYYCYCYYRNRARGMTELLLPHVEIN